MLLQNNSHSRHRALQEDKGKLPMHQSTMPPSSHPQQQQQEELEHRAAAPMVNPNYYTKNSNSRQPTSDQPPPAAASTSSFASSASQAHPATPAGSSSLATSEPAIALITDTMMGHWLWKHPRHQGLLRASPPHQRYVWMHPYTRTLYWSTHAPGAPHRDVKTKSGKSPFNTLILHPHTHSLLLPIALIQDMKVVPNGTDQHLPASIQVTTSEGDMKLTAPDMETHATWVEVIPFFPRTHSFLSI
jgi:hypothetical protein